jgi:hypothetical protein
MLQSEASSRPPSSTPKKRIRSPSGEKSMTHSPSDPPLAVTEVTAPVATSIRRISLGNERPLLPENAICSPVGDQTGNTPQPRFAWSDAGPTDVATTTESSSM